VDGDASTGKIWRTRWFRLAVAVCILNILVDLALVGIARGRPASEYGWTRELGIRLWMFAVVAPIALQGLIVGIASLFFMARSRASRRRPLK